MSTELDRYSEWSFHAAVAAATSNADLEAAWGRYAPGAPAEALSALREALTVRQAELAAPPEVQGAGQVEQFVGSQQVLARNEEDSAAALEAYTKALDEWAHAHTAFKTERAKAYVRMRADHKSAADTDNYVDADDHVADVRLRAYLAEGVMKAAKSNLDRLERQFQHHRSLFVTERKWDERQGGARG